MGKGERCSIAEEMKGRITEDRWRAEQRGMKTRMSEEQNSGANIIVKRFGMTDWKQ